MYVVYVLFYISMSRYILVFSFGVAVKCIVAAVKFTTVVSYNVMCVCVLIAINF